MESGADLAQKVGMVLSAKLTFLRGGPKCRHEIATSVRAWSGRHPNNSRRPEGPTHARGREVLVFGKAIGRVLFHAAALTTRC